jgi:hypothetical protein
VENVESPELMKASDADKALLGRSRSDLLHRVDAITLALKNWNDTEALRLLRLYWSEIAEAVQARETSVAISLPVLSAVPNGPDRRPQAFRQEAYDSAHDQDDGAHDQAVSREYRSEAPAPATHGYSGSAMDVTRNFPLVAKEAKYRS